MTSKQKKKIWQKLPNVHMFSLKLFYLCKYLNIHNERNWSTVDRVTRSHAFNLFCFVFNVNEIASERKDTYVCEYERIKSVVVYISYRHIFDISILLLPLPLCRFFLFFLLFVVSLYFNSFSAVLVWSSENVNFRTGSSVLSWLPTRAVSVRRFS